MPPRVPRPPQPRCAGFCRNGQPCPYRGRENGFCRIHTNQAPLPAQNPLEAAPAPDTVPPPIHHNLIVYTGSDSDTETEYDMFPIDQYEVMMYQNMLFNETDALNAAIQLSLLDQDYQPLPITDSPPPPPTPIKDPPILIGDFECSICCEPIQGCVMSQLPCEHNFHHKCISTWLHSARNDTCPNCRGPSTMQQVSYFTVPPSISSV